MKILRILALAACLGADQEPRRPNVVLILADDLGWRDLGCTGSAFYETPAIDRLASQGMRFTQAYAAANVCSPTRSALMTGKYPARLHTTNFFGGNRRGSLLPPVYRQSLPAEETTLAETFRQHGYRTAIAGKWHLGPKPADHGFDVVIGPTTRPAGGPPEDPHFATMLSTKAVEFIEQSGDRPFFLYLPLHSVHVGLKTRPELAAKYRAKPAPEGPRDVPAGPGFKARAVQDHAVYAGMAQEMDEAVDRVLKKLDDRTIVVFTSDNGGLSTAEGSPTSNLPLRAGKGWNYEGGIRVPLIVRMAGRVPAGSTCDVPVISNDIYPTLLELAGIPQPAVDGVSLAPLLERKGGIAERPIFWHYPHYSNQGGRPSGAVRMGRYKLLEFFEDRRVELYDLEADAGEQHDLAPAQAARAEEMRNLMVEWRSAVGAQMPSPNPNPVEPFGAEKPNIIVILADDIGYGDLGCYGATKVKTPNLDRLAAGGMRFTDAHSPAAVCTPSRYAMLTGQYAWRHPPGSRILSGVAPLCIPPGRVTIPSLLKQAGYATGVVGKWHLGLGETETDYNGEIKRGPRDVGFDSSFIIPATGDRVPCVYVEDHRVVGYDPADPIRVSYGKPVGDEPTGAKNPELLRVKPSHGHDNTIVNGISRIGYMTGGKAARWKDEEMADEITRKAVGFIEKNRERPFFLYFAAHDVHVPRVPHPRFQGTSGHGTRGDVIQELDWSVGEVMAALDRLVLTEKTLVIFSSDNGGVMDDGYQDGSGSDTSGHRCNGALRGFKGGLYEGGHRVPFIARWPGKTPAGKTSSELIGLVDLLATVAAVVGKELPAEAGPDSFNILPALLSEKPGKPCRDRLVMQAGGGALAIRRGPWKLIPGRAAQLYNLADDLAETTNLAAQNAEKVKELTDLLKESRAGK